MASMIANSFLLCCAVLLFLTRVNCQDALTESEKKNILDKHNELRGTVTNPTAANMVAMEWNDDLATLAQNFADNCVFRHNPTRHDQQSEFRLVGENLFASSAQSVNYDDFVQGWFNEVNDYTFDTKTCAPERICGHYTQVVWADSVALGCGVKRCSNPGLQVASQQRPNWIMLVCNYGPTGNINNDFPYVPGTPCSACPADKSTCVSNLCTPSSAPPAVTVRPPSNTVRPTTRPTQPPTPPPTPPSTARPTPRPTPPRSESFKVMRTNLENNQRRIMVRFNILRRFGGQRRVLTIRRG